MKAYMYLSYSKTKANGFVLDQRQYKAYSTWAAIIWSPDTDILYLAWVLHFKNTWYWYLVQKLRRYFQIDHRWWSMWNILKYFNLSMSYY